MVPAAASPLDLQGLSSKEPTGRPAHPPPPYTPHMRLDMASSPSLLSRPTPRRPSLASLITTSAGHTAAAAAAEVDDPDDTQQSGISLRINTSVRISSNNNHVCISDSPAENANAIARAVVHAIQQSSSGQCGIPMIDEDGRPRPVRIEVDAGIEVHGDGNVVGNEDLMPELLRQRQVLRRRRDDEHHLSPASSFKRTRTQ